MRCIENISLEIKVFKSLFVQIIDGLNFWHIDDNFVTILKCLLKRRRIFFLKASISPGFQGQQNGDQSTPREFGEGGGGGERNSPWRIFVTASISPGFRG